MKKTFENIFLGDKNKKLIIIVYSLIFAVIFMYFVGKAFGDFFYYTTHN